MKVPVPLPLSTNEAPVGSADVDSVGVVPFGSVADTAKVKSVFSFTDWLPMAAIAGGAFTKLTVIVTT